MKPSIPIPQALDTPDFREAWARWITHRRENRATLKPTTMRSQLKKLCLDGPIGAIARLQRSMDNGWRGLWFPDDPWPPGKAGQKTCRPKSRGEYTPAKKARGVDYDSLTKRFE